MLIYRKLWSKSVAQTGTKGVIIIIYECTYQIIYHDKNNCRTAVINEAIAPVW